MATSARINSKGQITVGFCKVGETAPNLAEIADAMKRKGSVLKRKDGHVSGPLPLLPLADRPNWMD